MLAGGSMPPSPAMWDRVVRDQARARGEEEESRKASRKALLTPKQHSARKAAMDESLRRLYPQPSPPRQQAPPASPACRHDAEVWWAGFMSRVEVDVTDRLLSNQQALAGDDRHRPWGSKPRPARLQSARESPRHSPRSGALPDVRPSTAGEVQLEGSAPPSAARSGSKSSLGIARGTTRRSPVPPPRTPPQSARQRRTSRRHTPLRNLINQVVPATPPWASPAPAQEACASGGALAAAIFAKVEKHIDESATPGKHSYLITPRRELAMTQRYVAQVDILQNLPEHARIHLASSMTTMYHIQPGQVSKKC